MKVEGTCYLNQKIIHLILAGYPKKVVDFVDYIPRLRYLLTHIKYLLCVGPGFMNMGNKKL